MTSTWLGKLGTFVSQVMAVAAVPMVLVAAFALRPRPEAEGGDPDHPHPCRICDAGPAQLPPIGRRVRYDPDNAKESIPTARRVQKMPVMARAEH